MCFLFCQVSLFSCQFFKVRSLRNRVGLQIIRVLVGTGFKFWGYEFLGFWESGIYVLRVLDFLVVWVWVWEFYNQILEEFLFLYQGVSFVLWIGLDFVYVVDGVGFFLLVFIVFYVLEYDIVLSCEIQVSGMGDRQVNGWCWLRGRGSFMIVDFLFQVFEDWQVLVSVRVKFLFSSVCCVYLSFLEYLFQVVLIYVYRQVGFCDFKY